MMRLAKITKQNQKSNSYQMIPNPVLWPQVTGKRSFSGLLFHFEIASTKHLENKEMSDYLLALGNKHGTSG